MKLIGGFAAPALPTTPAGVEVCAVAVFAGVRVVNLAQFAVASPVALREATSPVLLVVVLGGYLTESAAIGAVVMRARAYRDRRWGWADTATAGAVLLAQPLFTAASDRTGSWTAWGFACTLSSAVGAAVVFTRRRHVAAAVAVLAGCYLAATLPGAADGSAATALGNAFAYVGFAVLARLLVGYLRRLADDAERARAEAARAAAEAARLRERERQRRLLHDNISVLRLFAGGGVPEELDGPLRAQAMALANRVRAFLDDPPVDAGEPGPSLVSVLRAAVGDYRDLRVEASVDLAEGVPLPEPAAGAVRAAVGTLLANVRMHADASSVVVHADADPAEGEWEVTVADDGRGFDPAATPRGFGLRDQVERALAAHGIAVHVHSVPGDGTRVTLRGPLPASWEAAEPEGAP
ncbi:sensor histidine kinase [Actinomadura decatromicini]|uniref:ATP-binding protein n=1 Tax=Actinomadura decatromicini TaxID=2604572 RepID=A0A5D3FXW8_9ACTN|nr:ATP-binding protein [Actinomadura decatromicini]TYK53171.1 ATP-binding protein [Actinomadura decatromicini]